MSDAYAGAHADDFFTDPPSTGPSLRVRAALIVAALLAVAALWSQTYFGQVSDRGDKLSGCARSTQDRAEIAGVLAAAGRADHLVATDPRQPRRTRRARGEEGHVQRIVAASLRSRTASTEQGRAVFCARAFPPPSPWPWAG